MRLETVEDFERVAKALADPKSKPHEYEVRGFGYCRKCRAVTEYDGNFGLEGSYITCLKCKADFAWPQLVPGCEPIEMYAVTEEDGMPLSVQDEIRGVRSREAQRGFFLELLEEKKKASRRQERNIRSEVRRLAKIESALTAHIF